MLLERQLTTLIETAVCICIYLIMQLCLRVTFPLYNVVKSEIRRETLACGPDESRIVEQEVGCLLSES